MPSRIQTTDDGDDYFYGEGGEEMVERVESPDGKTLERSSGSKYNSSNNLHQSSGSAAKYAAAQQGPLRNKMNTSNRNEEPQVDNPERGSRVTKTPLAHDDGAELNQEGELPLTQNQTGDVQAMIDQLYTLWLRHAPSLYDFCTTHILEWPTSTCGFLADSRREIPGRDYAVHQIFFGSNSPAVNYVNIYHTFLPCALDDQDEFDGEDYEAFNEYSGRFVDVAPLMQRYLRVVHDGPALNIKSMPQKPQILATRGRKNFVYIYDVGRRRAEPETNAVKADLRLKGHSDEGYGMCWNPERTGLLASTSEDQTVKVWDIEAEVELCGTRACMDMGSVHNFTAHTSPVEDCSWHFQHSDILATTGVDGQLCIWDIRSKTPIENVHVHREAATSVQFHPTASFMVATAGADNSVRVWDLRSLSRKPIAEFWGHTDVVSGIEWAPFNDTIIMSWSDDRSVICWDLSKLDEEVKQGEDDHARPELVFRHYGHTARVRCAQWCPTGEDEWTVMSCDDNNFLQTWAPYERVYNDQADLEAYNTDVV